MRHDRGARATPARRPGMSGRLRRLRGRSPAEWRERSAQAASRWLERIGFGDIGEPTGERLKNATLVARKAGEGQQEYYKIMFSDCLVSSYQQGGAVGTALIPTDQASLSFGKIEIEYTEQKADGSLGAVVKGGYDLKLNKSM